MGTTKKLPIMAVFTWAVVIFFLGYAISLFTSNYKLITTGECINLDEYLEGSEDDEIPYGKIVNVTVTRDFGRFYTRVSHGRHHSTTYYNALEVADGSIIVYGSTINDPHLGVNTGRITKVRVPELEEELDAFTRSLKNDGLIADDAVVRYVLFTDGWGRVGIIILIGFLVVMAVLLGLLAYKLQTGKEIGHKGQDKNYTPKDEVHYFRLTKKDWIKFIIEYIIGTIIIFVALYIYGEGWKDGISYKTGIVLSLIFGLIVPILFVVHAKGEKADVPGIGSIYINSPLIKMFEKLDETVKTVGYTEEMVRDTDEVIKLRNDKQPIDMIFFKDFILNTADYCVIKGDYQKAYEYISNLTADELMDRSIYQLDKGIACFSYWTLLFEILRGLGDLEAMEEQKKDCDRYWNNKYLMTDDSKKFFKDVCMYHYHMLKDEPEKALECAERLIMYDTIETTNITAYVLNAEVLLKLGKKEDAAVMMGFAEERSDNAVYACIKQSYEAWAKKLGFWNRVY